MRKTYITTMPDHIGAFLKASECFAKLGVNITRVSYNKAVDSHMLFIDVEGQPDQVYDNTIFYQSFVSGLMRRIGLSEDQRDNLLINTNLVMQISKSRQKRGSDSQRALPWTMG